MTSGRSVVILGATGSIGTQALEVISAAQNSGAASFQVQGLAAGGSNIRFLAEQAVQYRPEILGIATGDPAELKRHLQELDSGYCPEILVGEDAATELAGRGADVVLNAVTGSIGLAPTLAALRAGSTLALANKESLVAGGPLVQALAAEGQIVPVDSEHSALAQCLRSGRAQEVSKLVLTASGGPFRGKSQAELADVTPQQALAHPTWDMGLMVTTNSATLVNKGLEVIEAHLLFGVPLEQIEVVVHLQSIVHSMVEFVDGSTIAQASPPDMRLPIALGLNWPDRLAGAAAACDWSQATQWTFEPLDEQAFPAVALAKAAAQRGGTCPAVYNAANEEAVLAFHAGSIGFLAIVEIVQKVVTEYQEPAGELTAEAVWAAEAWARNRAQELIQGAAA